MRSHIHIVLLCLQLLQAAALRAQPINHPVAKYTFNNNQGKDEVGHNDAKMYNAMPTFDRFGNKNYACYLFGNIDSYINLGSSNVLKPQKGSISLWVKMNTITYNGKGVPGNPVIQTQSNGSGDFNEAYSLGYNYNMHHMAVATSLSEQQQAYIHPDKMTTLREWHHMVMTYDDDYLCFYIDGVMEGKVTKGFKSEFLAGSPVIVGQCNDGKNLRFFVGCVDDIEFYNCVLSPREVQLLYHAPNPNRNQVILNWCLLIAACLAAVVLVLWLLINRYIARRLRKAKEEDRLKIQWYEQENKVLKAQMNPHFIFNSLNTIQQFIIVNENDKAQLYLTRFSRLIRKLLESNTSDNISLKEEIEICEKYLEIESLRFDAVFSYKIVVKGHIDIKAIHIPHFLIQPFIENAIWHGLLPKKEGNKHLEITFELLDEKTLLCVVDDNGVGRKNASDMNMDGKKSLAINFIKQRLQLMSRMKEADYNVEIIDKTEHGHSAGTSVQLKIPAIVNPS